MEKVEAQLFTEFSQKLETIKLLMFVKIRLNQL